MEYPTHSPRKFLGMLQQYRETQLLFAGISLKVFDYLKHDTSAEKIASITGYDERNLILFLNSLAAIGLLEKNNHQFRNTPETELFLNQNNIPKNVIQEAFCVEKRMPPCPIKKDTHKSTNKVDQGIFFFIPFISNVYQRSQLLLVSLPAAPNKCLHAVHL